MKFSGQRPWLWIAVLGFLWSAGSGSAAQALDKVIALADQSLAFSLPENWQAQEITAEAAQDGILYIANNPDAPMIFLVQEKPLRRNGGLDALEAWSKQGENVSVGERVDGAGTAFLLSEEVMKDGAATLTYRVAAGIQAGRWIRLILADYTDQGGQTVKGIVESFQNLSAAEPWALP